MRIDINMTREENKFTSERWWASSAGFVLHTLNSQLRAAAVVFPELAGWTINPPPAAPSCDRDEGIIEETRPPCRVERED